MTSNNMTEAESVEPSEAAPAKSVDDQLTDELVGRAQAEGLRLTGEGGLLQQLTKRLLESALEGEITDHLGYDKHDPAGKNGGNSRNGTRAKTVLTDVGPVGIAVPRDREGSLEPRIVKKRQKRLTGVDEMVISLAAKGLTTGEVQAHLAEVYGADVSRQTDTCSRPSFFTISSATTCSSNRTMSRDIDTDLRVVVHEVEGHMEVPARVGLLRDTERPSEGLMKRHDPLPHQLALPPRQEAVRAATRRRQPHHSRAAVLGNAQHPLRVVPPGVAPPGQRPQHPPPLGDTPPPRQVGRARNPPLHSRQNPAPRPEERRVRPAHPVRILTDQEPAHADRKSLYCLLDRTTLRHHRPLTPTKRARRWRTCEPAPHSAPAEKSQALRANTPLHTITRSGTHGQPRCSTAAKATDSPITGRWPRFSRSPPHHQPRAQPTAATTASSHPTHRTTTSSASSRFGVTSGSITADSHRPGRSGTALSTSQGATGPDS